MTDILTTSVRLVAVATAVSGARQFVTEMLRLWGVPGELVDDACLVTSELVTNAVCATGSPEPEPSLEALAGLELVGLRLTLGEGRLLIEVADVSDIPPRIEQQHEAAEHGRGLVLVTMLAARWAYYPVATGGKVVWAEMVVPSDGEQSGATVTVADQASNAQDAVVRSAT